MPKDIEAEVKRIVADELMVDDEEVTLNAHFTDDLGGDSLDQVELIMALEEAFNIQIADDEAEGIHTVGEAVKYIQAHTKS